MTLHLALVLALLLGAAKPALAKQKIVPVHVPEGRIEEPTAPESKSVGVLVAQGNAELKAGKLFEADSKFRHALAINGGCAPALEGLAGVAAARGDREEAVRQLRRALPLEPAERVGDVELMIGDHLAAQGRWAEAEVAYRPAMDHWGLNFDSRYKLGLALYKQRKFREAEYWLREAEEALEWTEPSVRRAHAALLHMLLAESYSALKYPRYAIAEAQDALSSGGADDVRRTAQKVEDVFDQRLMHLSLAVAHEYDTNVLPPHHTIVDLNGSKAIGGGALLGQLDFSLQTTPARRWSFGFDVPASLDTHPAASLAGLDTLVASPSMWVAWWNLKNMELKLFYDYSAALLDRNAYALFLQTDGPELTWRLFWDKRHELAAGFSSRRVVYPGDQPGTTSGASNPNQQGGFDERVFVRLAFAGPSPRVQPFLQYTFDDNLANGTNFHALISTVEAGFATWLGEARARLLFSGAYSHVGFPENPARGSDRVGRARAAFELPLAPASHWSAKVAADYTTSHSDLQSLFSFDRLVVTSGISYDLTFY